MATVDVWDALDNPQVKTAGTDTFGQCFIDSYPAVLIKGAGKIPFDPSQHKEEQRVTAVKISVMPLAEMNLRWDVDREMIAESKEWAGTVLPSIKALGVSTGQLHEKWVHIQLKGLGTYYKGRDGQDHERSTVVFVQVYANEAECRAAYNAFAAGNPAPSPVAPANGSGTNGNGSGAEKETAGKFLPAIVLNACKGQKDLDVIRNTIAANLAAMPQFGKHYTVDSPEVVALIMESINK